MIGLDKVYKFSAVNGMESPGKIFIPKEEIKTTAEKQAINNALIIIVVFNLRNSNDIH